MSTARAKFLLNMRAALDAARDQLLLDNATDPAERRNAARLLRNGLAVTSFAAFEMFVRDRLNEIATWLTSQSIPFSAFPTGLQSAPQRRAPGILRLLMEREPNSAIVATAYQELGASWSQAQGGGGWTIPHVSLLWEGSNLSAGVMLEITTMFGGPTQWGDMSGIAKGAGFAVLPTSQLFDQIAKRRHSSAHNAAFDADILLLRATPSYLTSHAFAIDAALSAAARHIAQNVTAPTGRNLVSLTTLDQSASDPNEWALNSGFLDSGTPPVATIIAGSESAVTMSARRSLTAPTDVLQLRKWSGSTLETTDWFTMGV